MSLKLLSFNFADLKPVSGVELGCAETGVCQPNRNDLLIIRLAFTATVAGVFTNNLFCAAPVQICKENLKKVNSDIPIRALLINVGNANAGTGKNGLVLAQIACNQLAELLNCLPRQILPFSTGVILAPLPIDRIKIGLPLAIRNLGPNNWFSAAKTIMTTDTRPKAVSQTFIIHNKCITITGIGKGSGMIRPNMATMLSFIASDVKMPYSILKTLVQDTANQSFNCITVDGETSTNDAFLLIATGTSGLEITDVNSVEYKTFRDIIYTFAQDLACQIVLDGEGATKFITVVVEEGKSIEECRKIAYTIANSPLVKTAFFASDPNLGRILVAIGYAGVNDLDVSKLDLYLDDLCVAKNGELYPEYTDINGKYIMQKSKIKIHVKLARGTAKAKVWTCDFSHDYISINANYRS